MPIFNPEIECASRDYLRAVQSARLIKMVKNAYENVPFYKAKFDEIGLKPEDIHSIDDISKLPFTVKTEDDNADRQVRGDEYGQVCIFYRREFHRIQLGAFRRVHRVQLGLDKVHGDIHSQQ